MKRKGRPSLSAPRFTSYDYRRAPADLRLLARLDAIQPAQLWWQIMHTTHPRAHRGRWQPPCTFVSGTKGGAVQGSASKTSSSVDSGRSLDILQLAISLNAPIEFPVDPGLQPTKLGRQPAFSRVVGGPDRLDSRTFAEQIYPGFL